jgi:D-alanyl-D-alanine carboxypeptidase (penicillin-binding protein 5/6)
MRRSYLGLLGAALLMLLWPAAPVAAAGPRGIAASGYELMDLQTGQILLAHRSQLRLAPASTTKIMTALLTVMQGHLGHVVQVSRQAYGVEGSSAYLVPGQRLSIRDLLYGLLLVSGNDAAVELAIAEAGSVPAFVQRMNSEAKTLGATGTTFLNPDGLYLPRHLTTAHDLALITRQALAYPTFRNVDATKSFQFPGVPKPYTLVNQNVLLWNYPGAIGVKIGYTIQAHQSIVAAATRDGTTLIAVALHTDFQHIWLDPQVLLNWGFSHFHQLQVVKAGEPFGRAPTGTAHADATGGFAWLTGPGQTLPPVHVIHDWPKAYRAGEPVGRVVVGPRRAPLAVIPLVASGPSPLKAAAGGMLHWAEAGLALGVVIGGYRLRRSRRRRRYRFVRR